MQDWQIKKEISTRHKRMEIKLKKGKMKPQKINSKFQLKRKNNKKCHQVSPINKQL